MQFGQKNFFPFSTIHVFFFLQYFTLLFSLFPFNVSLSLLFFKGFSLLSVCLRTYFVPHYASLLLFRLVSFRPQKWTLHCISHSFKMGLPLCFPASLPPAPLISPPVCDSSSLPVEQLRSPARSKTK